MITNQTSSVSYVGDGIVTEFPVSFHFLEPEFLRVYLTIDDVDVEQQLNTHYTVDEEETEGVYGTVVFLTAPPDTFPVKITRSIPTTQETDLQPADRFNPDTVERMADKLTLLIQQAEAMNSLTLRFPDGEPEPVTNKVPVKALRPNTVLGFDEDGNLRTYTMAELADVSGGDGEGSANAYDVVEVEGDFTVTTAHRNRTIHSTDTTVPQATNTITLPDPTTLPAGFFLSLVKAATADVTFASTATINAEVDPATLTRANAGVVVYSKGTEWWIVGAFGDSLPAPDVTINVTENSGIHRADTAPTDPYVGQPWIDTNDDRSLQIWDGTQWQLSTPLVKQANAATDQFVVVRVDALPALPDTDYPVNTLVLYSGGLYVNIANVWTNTAIAGSTIVVGANVVNTADTSRPAPAVGSAFHQFAMITSAEQILATDTPFTDNNLIIYSWTNGTAARINNRMLADPTRFAVMFQYNPDVGSGANTLISLAYRTRLTEAGAWSAWTKLGDPQKPVNETGHDQVQEDLQWAGSIAVPSTTDIQFGVILNRTGGTVDITTSRMQVLVFNL